MSKQGKRTPKAIEQFVVDAHRNAPRLTYLQVVDRVAETFGEAARLDKSTIGNILQRYGIAGGQAPEAVPVDPLAGLGEGQRASATSKLDSAWPGPLEDQEHANDLREVATELSKQVEIHLEQLVDPPSKLSPGNSNPRIEQRGETLAVLLDVEEIDLFDSLQQHLPGHQIWGLFDRWKTSVLDTHRQLRRLCYWVKDQPDVMAQELRGSPGPNKASDLIDKFCDLVVFTAVDYEDPPWDIENSDIRQRMEREYEVLPVGSDQTLHKLVWNSWDEKMSRVIARSQQEAQLEESRQLHLDLRKRIRHTPGFTAAVLSRKKLDELQAELNVELERIRRRPWFRPSTTCRVCDLEWLAADR